MMEPQHPQPVTALGQMLREIAEMHRETAALGLPASARDSFQAVEKDILDQMAFSSKDHRHCRWPTLHVCAAAEGCRDLVAAAGGDGIAGEDARANRARVVCGGAPDGDFRLGAMPPNAGPPGHSRPRGGSPSGSPQGSAT